MKLNVSKVHKILVISLSNVGDVILTLPVIDILKRDFPNAELAVVVGPKGQSMFMKNPLINKVLIFDKTLTRLQHLFWLLTLRKERYDLIVDLKNTAIPFLIGGRFKTRIAHWKKDESLHMKTKHLNRLHAIFPFIEESKIKHSFFIPQEDKEEVDRLLVDQSIKDFVIISPGAANHAKRWTAEGFAGVSDALSIEYGMKVIAVGDENDYVSANQTAQLMKYKLINFCGKTSLPQLAYLLSLSRLAIVNDSGVLHMASYVDVPVVALFGPTDEKKYGPWSTRHTVVRRNISCPKCEKPNSTSEHECMKQISVNDVLLAAQALLKK